MESGRDIPIPAGLQESAGAIFSRRHDCRPSRPSPRPAGWTDFQWIDGPADDPDVRDDDPEHGHQRPVAFPLRALFPRPGFHDRSPGCRGDAAAERHHRCEGDQHARPADGSLRPHQEDSEPQRGGLQREFGGGRGGGGSRVRPCPATQDGLRVAPFPVDDGPGGAGRERVDQRPDDPAGVRGGGLLREDPAADLRVPRCRRRDRGLRPGDPAGRVRRQPARSRVAGPQRTGARHGA